ncbi:hypothetical protein BaRGS_00012827 [Batillaria attramentaria]|uniref:Uncharacterized protein n=1 Tax=Batillaria attramentaria TaxID=370345 RepID=A0ABD0L9K5_9CAEN
MDTEQYTPWKKAKIFLCGVASETHGHKSARMEKTITNCVTKTSDFRKVAISRSFNWIPQASFAQMSVDAIVSARHCSGRPSSIDRFVYSSEVGVTGWPLTKNPAAQTFRVVWLGIRC